MPINHLRGVMAVCFLCLGFTVAAAADSIIVEMRKVTPEGPGQSIGQVTVTYSKFGLVFSPDLHGLPPGLHGFHLHEKPACGSSRGADGALIPGGAAGGHYDPNQTGRHGTPWDLDGHLGDLPALYVDPDGRATLPVLAPKLRALEDIEARSLMIHAGGDNYSDQPEANGGGGARLACGVFP